MMRCDHFNVTLSQTRAGFPQLVHCSRVEGWGCAASHFFTFLTGRDAQVESVGSVTANLLGQATEWSVVAGGWCLPRPSKGPYLKGGAHTHSAKLTAASTPTPAPGTSKVPQKDSQTSRGAHPGPSLMQGYKLPQPSAPWRLMPTDTGECWPLKHISKSKHTIPLPPFPGSGTGFCPLDLMDHSVLTANVGDPGRL